MNEAYKILVNNALERYHFRLAELGGGKRSFSSANWRNRQFTVLFMRVRRR